MNKTKSKYKASALIVSLLILGAIVVTALSVSLVSIKERAISSRVSKANQAFQNADSGIENVMYEITEGGHSDTSEIPDCLASGKIENASYNYKVQLKDSDGNIIDCDSGQPISNIASIKSVGTQGETHRAIEATVPVTP